MGAEPPPAWATRLGSQWFLLPNPTYGSWERALATCPGGQDDQACRETRRRGKYQRLIRDP